MTPIHDPEQKQPGYSDMTQRTQEQHQGYQKHLLNGSVVWYDSCIKCRTQIEKSQDQNVIRISTG